MNDKINNVGYDFNLQKIIGLLSDDYTKNTVIGMLKKNDLHSHSIGLCYPTLSNGILLTGGSSSWELGNFVEIIPENTIIDYFDIHWVSAYNASVADSYQINLYQGLEGFEQLISEIPVARDATQSGVSPNKALTPILNPNTRISGKLASLSGGNDTIRIKLQYHKY